MTRKFLREMLDEATRNKSHEWRGARTKKGQGSHENRFDPYERVESPKKIKKDRVSRKYIDLGEARSKEQQIKGQKAILDQKIKAEYDAATKNISRKKKKVTTGTGGSPYQVYKAPLEKL